MDNGFDLNYLQNIRSNRRFVIELFLFAILLGISVNLLASFIVNILTCDDAHKDTWVCASVWASGAILIIFLGALFTLCKQKLIEHAEIASTLAVLMDDKSQRVEFLGHPRFQAASYASELYTAVDDATKDYFSAHWPKKKPFPLKDFTPEHPCWEKTADMVEACLILLLRHYGDHTLTPNAMYHTEFRRLANAVPKTKLSIKDLPLRIRNNLFLSARLADTLLVPKASRFSLKIPKGQLGGNKDHLQYGRRLSLITPYGQLDFSLSKYWTILGDHKTAKREFPKADLQRTVFLRIPIDIKLSFSPGFRSFHKVQAHYLWFKKLIDNTRRRMDWGVYLRSKQDGPSCSTH